MNAKRFKVVFSKRRNALMVVGENASSVTKSPGTSGAPGVVKPGLIKSSAVNVALQGVAFAISAIFLAVHTAYAEPTGGEFAAGAGAISQAGNLTTIQQNTQHAIVNWQSFGSEAHETIKFVQPNIDSAILNRVVGNLPSNLNGVLEGNGRVYLINQNGIVLGQNGVINVNGGFVGSTRDVTNDAFMAGGALIYKGESIGNIQILGKVKSDQGDIVLIAQKVDVKAGAELVAGEKVQLVAANEVQLTDGKITIKPSTTDKGQITVEGAVKAAQVQLLANNNNLGALAINTSGNIRATGTQTNPDGSVNIIATGEGGNINISGNVRSEKGDGKGGAVTVLADNAIRVSGTIDANSTDATKKGGDIIIGRDIDTGKLAKATDVSNATLLSNKGFVETSGDYLATDGVSVKAAEWLLDPSDITISNSPNTNVTGTSPSDITPTGSTGSSNVLVSTITGAINGGTNVTIKTTNASATGAGNITIVDALTFNNTGATDATLSLIADNGITQNAAISATGSKLVNISMEAKGNYQGNTAANALSKGITLNAAINTNGDVTLNGTTNNSAAATASNAIGVDIKSASAITAKSISITGNSQSSFGIQSNSVLKATEDITLKGTSKNWVGIVTGRAITAGGMLTITGDKTSAAGYQGANIGANLTGASVSLIGNSIGHYGVEVAATATIKSTLGNVYIEGNASNTAAAFGQNVSSGTRIFGVVDALGKATIKGTTSDAGLYQGLIISNTVKGSSVELIGNSVKDLGVELKNTGLITATNGSVSINGTSGTSDAVRLGVQNTLTNTAKITATGDVNITGVAGNSSLAQSGITGVRLYDGVIITAGDSSTNPQKIGSINITGTVDTQSGKSGNGVDFQRYPTAARLTATGDISINGTVTGAGGGSGVTLTQSGTTGQAPMMNAGGKFTLRGNNRAATGTGNASASISGVSGIQVTAGSDIVIQAETQNAAVRAINFESTSAAVSGNASFKSTNGNVLIQTNQGAISFSNALPTNAVTGTYTALTDIRGKNITIDNTGAGMATGVGNLLGSGGTTGGTIGSGSIDSATGTIAKGSGKSTYASGGAITLNSSAGLAITATENVNIAAVNIGATAQSGLYTGAATNISGKNVTIDGSSLNGNGVYTNGAITATSGDVSITGTSTGAPISPLPQTASALSLQGAITAYNNVTIVGNNTNISNGAAVAYINKAVTATTGKIDITTTTAGTTSNALQLVSGANLSAATAVNIKTDTLSIDTSLTPATISASAPTGTVTIKTDSAAAKIDIGNGTSTSGVDSGSGTRTLGLTNAELNRITAANLVIGDANNTGGLKVSAATTTNTTTGNLTLQTSGGMSITGALTAGNTTLKDITLLAKSSGFGLTHQAKVKGDNITMRAESTATAGNILGYYGAGSGAQFEAAKSLDLTGITSSQGNGFYSIGGTYTAGTGIAIKGTSANGQGVGFDQNVNITNTTGDINITGTATNTSNIAATTGVHTEGIALRGSKITNNGGNTKLTAVNGNVLTTQGTWTGSIPNEIINSSSSNGIIQITAGNASAINSGGVDGTALTITQNGNGGVLVSSSGTGNVTAPKIVNTSTGDVVIAAGTQIAAGDGSGGQVKTVSGNTITQSSSGKTYLYTGNANDTGALSTVGGFTNGLFLSTIGTDIVNTASNTAYVSGSTRNTITDGANTQVIFREKVALSGALNNATVTYGDSTNSAAVKAALQATNTGASNVISTTSNAGTFKILNADLIVDMATGKPSVDTALSLTTNKSTSGNLKANSAGYDIDIAGTKFTLNTTAKLVVAQKSVTISAAGNTVIFNSQQQFDNVNKPGVITGDNVGVEGAGTGREAGTYQSNLRLSGAVDDGSNYNINFTNSELTITAQTYVRPPVETNILSPVSFGLAYAGGATAAGGDGVDIAASCDAWSQRAGAGSVAVMTLLKTSFMGLRNAKTDSMDAMNGGSASASAVEASASPCSSSSLANKQAGL
jgi:filamentous hemagglutinin family protein